MSLKDLFKEKLEASKFANESLDTIAEEVESADYLKRFVEERERFVPQVDFSDPANFVFFGSAEQYYEDTIRRVYQDYPYDGSRKEALEWHLSSSYFDNWFLENEYPRTNGFVRFSPSGWGTATQTAGDYGLPSTVEYIIVKGGPNKDATNKVLSKIYPDDGGTANVYNTAQNRASNLHVDLQNNGVTLEFWLKKDAFTTSLTKKEVIFDLWNGQASSSADYGRLTFEISGTAASESPFYITAQSGTSGFFNQKIGSSIAGTGSLSTWNHYAISLMSGSNGVETKFYVNGDLNQSTKLGTDGINNITGSLIAYVGALQTAPSGNTFHGLSMTGYGKLSGSIDELRYWKTQRTSENIGRYWFTQVGAGTNTDTANTDLGVYYKFNEGITGVDAVDSVVLDYSGRVSNGTWTGYSATSRATASAMVQAGAASTEFLDPIIRTRHPDLIALQDDKRLVGIEYDYRNNSSIKNSYPGWILDDDGDDGELAKLTQIISSYFDTLYLQIEAISNLKDVTYLSSSASGSWKPYAFSEKLLNSSGLVASDIFIEADIIEQFLDRDEDRDYEYKLDQTKNLIFQNIYNNLTYIYKSKGTEKAFRNLIRCFGVDDELIKLNLYADGVTYPLTDNYREGSYRNTYADFNAEDRFEATVHQFTNPDNDNTVSYISGSTTTALQSGSAFTIEAEIKLPNKRSEDDRFYFETPFTQSSLFGLHTADSSLSENNLAWAADDVSNFQVYAVRNGIYSTSAKFFLTGTLGGHVPHLTSSVYVDAYNDERWILAVRIKPLGHPMAGVVQGTETDAYEINFYGANATFGTITNEFELTGTVSHQVGFRMLSNPKRIFAGAHLTNFTGSLLNKTDVKVGAVRVWQSYLPNEALRAHAIDPSNNGAAHPSRRAYLFEDQLGTLDVRQIETLALQWTFDTLTGSNASGQFTVPDVSSGSASDRRFGEYSNIINRQHSGRGTGFPVSTTASLDKDYDFAYTQRLPEILTNADTVKVLTQDDETFTRESRPINYFYSIEKSMYQEISADMLQWFATIKDYNNLVGDPVNRYRQEYKDLSKLRQLFFERVRNTPDFEKFTTFYKWFDSALNGLVQQLIPGSANASEEIQNMVESHILERNKYWTKFPTVDSKASDPEGGLNGVNELLYDWKTGHAPIPAREQDNCFWWNQKALRDGPVISSGNDNIDNDRNKILTASLQVLNRRFTTPHRFAVSKDLNLHGGVNLPSNKKPDVALTALKPASTETIDVTLESVPHCNDGQNSPTRYGKKIKIPQRSVRGPSADATNGGIISPFNVFSSSAGNTSLEISTNKELTNLHIDGYGSPFSTPAQGPFTEKYVGGLQYRHQPLMDSVIDTPAVPAKTPGENAANADYTTAAWASGNRGSNGCPAPAFELIYVLTNQLGTSFSQQILVDGGFTQGQRFLTDSSLESNSYIAFNFNQAGCSTTDDPQVITEAKWIFYTGSSPPTNQGTWKYQGSNNSTNGVNGDWTDIGGNVVLADTSDLEVYTGTIYMQQVHDQLSANTTEYNWYRLVGVSGQTTNSSHLDIREVQFKVAFAQAAQQATYRLLNETERAEGFRLKIADSTVQIMQPEKNSLGTINRDLPVARYYRDELAKRPVNVRNIQHTTGSTIIGNYDELYQVLQTSGRRINNRWWVQTASAHLNENQVLLNDADSFLVGAEIANPHISGAVEYAKPNRGKTPYVIVERFGAPGGADSSGDSDGGPGLDTLSAEFSVYSTCNYRNALVRQALDEWSTEHAAFGGEDPDDANLAAYQKTNRNAARRVELSGATFITASTFDNLFVQHQIPQSDLQYAWITASAQAAPLGFAADPRTFPAESDTITFLSASLIGSERPGAPLSGFRTYGMEVSKGRYPLANDFVGLNSNIHEPVTSSTNTIGQPDFALSTVALGMYGETYSNYQGGLIDFVKRTGVGAYNKNGITKTLNGLLHHRNGPYGYPMWKQIRAGEGPIGRYQKKNNEIDYVRQAVPSETTTITVGNFALTVPVARSLRVSKIIEPSVLANNRPLITSLNMEVGEDEPRDLSIKHSYGNNLSYFANEQLNNNLIWPRLGNKPGLVQQNAPIQTYDDLVELYKDPRISPESNPVKDFISLRYSESIYPRAYNSYLTRTRSRTNYDVASILKWQGARVDRAQQSTANSQGNSQPPEQSSMWPVDGRFESGSFTDARILTIASASTYTANNALLSGGFDGSGELLNDYVQFHNGTVSKIAPAALYARRQLEYMCNFGSQTGLREVAAGDAKWEAATQSGKRPFYDNYDDFADDIAKIGNGFSIIPEFRISDHIEYYIDENASDFFVDLPDSVFNLEGASLTGSEDRRKIDGKNFFSLYNSTDFLKHFQIINNDHDDEEFDKDLTLSCQSIMKFRPRDGFFPIQRTLQMATLFSQSYGPTAKLEGAQASWRSLLGPFVAPGILFNTIKAGVACDYPIMTDDYSIGMFSPKPGYAGTTTNKPVFGPWPYAAVNAYPYTDPVTTTWWGNLIGQGSMYYISSSFDDRIPFEGLVNPEAYIAGKNIVDLEPHPSASLNSTASFSGGGSPLYRLAINNFLAESANLFLSEKPIGTFTSFISKPDTNRNFFRPEKGKTYKMEVVLTNQLEESTTTTTVVSETDVPRAFYTGSITMYRRADHTSAEFAFGPPVLELQQEIATVSVNTVSDVRYISAAPFTPPHYDGPAKVTFSFTHYDDNVEYTAPQLISEITATYSREGLLEGFGGNPSFATDAAMQISSSINLNSIIENKILEKDANGNVIAIKDSEGNINNSIWVIEPKFETPILDFSTVNVSLPISGSGSVPRGMWHQYGSVPSDASKGLFLQVRDTTGATDESLADLVGFDKSAKRLGEVADVKTISEAIVAIPIIRGTSNNAQQISFVPLVTNDVDPDLGKKVIADAKDAIKEGFSSGPRLPELADRNVIRMVRQMQKYILPPKWDFVNNPEQTQDPFVIYMFEFQHDFNRQDLVDMWQNLAPDETRIAKNNVGQAQSTHGNIFVELKKQGKTISDLEWIVFKVKQRASINYFEKTLSNKDDDEFKIKIGEREDVPTYSYNWPYDYFSMVELVKVDAEVKITKATEELTREERAILNEANRRGQE